MPTRFGNVMRSAEEYSLRVYGLDAVIWWPRLAVIFPEAFRSSLLTARTQMIAMINLCTVSAIVAVVGGAVLVWDRDSWSAFALTFAVGLLAAKFFYFAAVTEARGYGQLVRASFDLYRHDLLKNMNLRVPSDLRQEFELWDSLNNWVYRYQAPWHGTSK